MDKEESRLRKVLEDRMKLDYDIIYNIKYPNTEVGNFISTLIPK